MDVRTSLLLENVAGNASEDAAVRIAAINQLDPSHHRSKFVLENVTGNASENPDVRMAAIRRLGDAADR